MMNFEKRQKEMVTKGISSFWSNKGRADILDYVSQRLSEIEIEPLYSEEEMWSEEYQPMTLEEDENCN